MGVLGAPASHSGANQAVHTSWGAGQGGKLPPCCENPPTTSVLCGAGGGKRKAGLGAQYSVVVPTRRCLRGSKHIEMAHPSNRWKGL